MKKLSVIVIALWITLILALLTPATAKSDVDPVEDNSAQILQEHVEMVADAILEAEGRCGHGQSGEYGCFQYQSGTWRAYSIEIEGSVLAQTETNERQITEGMIRKWILEGKTDRWIFLQWNQGNGDGWGPGTKDCYAGVNKYGVRYDSCDYAKRALASIARARSSTAAATKGGATVLE